MTRVFDSSIAIKQSWTLKKCVTIYNRLLPLHKNSHTEKKTQIAACNKKTKYIQYFYYLLITTPITMRGDEDDVNDNFYWNMTKIHIPHRYNNFKLIIIFLLLLTMHMKKEQKERRERTRTGPFIYIWENRLKIIFKYYILYIKYIQFYFVLFRVGSWIIYDNFIHSKRKKSWTYTQNMKKPVLLIKYNTFFLLCSYYKW